MKTLVKLSGVHKSFPKSEVGKSNLSAVWKLLFNKQTDETTTVLEDIDLQIDQGHSLAVIGRNGAGKSTLLKIISGIIQASKGTVSVQGSIGALLELGSGFDLEYSGYENLKLASALAGIKHQDIDEKIQQMIEFSGIGEQIHDPVKHYSSGMVVRLGFSVITVTKPDLLITDEVLAVGDEQFQRKCIQWMDEYIKSGGTLLLVSHSMYHVQKICDQAVWLKDGKIHMKGDAYQVSQAYQSQFEQVKKSQETTFNHNNYHVTSFEVKDEFGHCVHSIESGKDIFIEVDVYSPDTRVPGLALGVVRSDDVPIYGTFSDIYAVKPQPVSQKSYKYSIQLPKLNLLPGLYFIRVHAMNPEHVQLMDTHEMEIRVTGKTREMGVTRLNTKWN